MIKVNNQFNSDGLLFERTIKKDDEFHSYLIMNYTEKNINAKYKIEKLAPDYFLSTHYWNYKYDDNDRLIESYETSFLGEKYDHSSNFSKKKYNYEMDKLINIERFKVAFGGNYENIDWLTEFEYESNKLIKIVVNTYEFDMGNLTAGEVKTPFEESKFYYDGSKVIGKSFYKLHEDLYDGVAYYNAYRYDKNGVFFWDYHWYKMLDSMDDYNQYNFDLSYNQINEKIGERLTHSEISFEGEIIGIVQNHYSKR